MLSFLATLSPNAAVLILTLGIALIAVELNRPGSILPGACGLLLALLSLAALLSRRPNPLALGLVLAAVTILLVQLRYRIGFWLICLAAAATVAGLVLLPHVAPPVAIFCGLILAAGTTVLTRIARRARQNKGLD